MKSEIRKMQAGRKAYSAPHLVALDAGEARTMLREAASAGNAGAAALLAADSRLRPAREPKPEPMLAITVRLPETQEAEISISADHLSLANLQFVADWLQAAGAALRTNHKPA